MTLGAFTFTSRVRPIVELGTGDTRVPTGQARWDSARWDTAPAATWAGTEPVWHDITCDTNAFNCTYGRQRISERFVVGTATVTVDNATGWADPNTVTDPSVLTMRPGRAIRMGVAHSTLGVRWLFRGFVDAVTPTYDPVNPDSVQIDCIDALGEVNRAELGVQAVSGAGETVHARIGRVLDAAGWEPTKRDLQPTAVTLIAHDLGGQVADLIGQAADSGGGSVFGDMSGSIAYRPRDWQTFTPGTPPDGTIGNVAAGDVCPTRWERPFARADITTRAIMGRADQDNPGTVILDHADGRLLYGIEPFKRSDLLTESDYELMLLAERILRTRNASTAPRVRSVSLSAATADNALDLMSTVDVYDPSRYRCRLQYDRGLVFDEEYFATGVTHDVTPSAWTLDLNLDSAAPFAAVGDRWDTGRWNTALWAWTTDTLELQETT